MSISPLWEYNSTFFQVLSLRKDESISSSLINLDWLISFYGNLRSLFSDWFRDGHVTQFWPIKLKARLWVAFGRAFLVERTWWFKGMDSEVDCLVYNPGSTTY